MYRATADLKKSIPKKYHYMINWKTTTNDKDEFGCYNVDLKEEIVEQGIYEYHCLREGTLNYLIFLLRMLDKEVRLQPGRAEMIVAAK